MKIRSDILRIYQTLHTWVGIGAGMLLFIGFFAGALTMFEQPLERWISKPPANATAAVTGERMDLLVRELLARHPAAREEFTLHLTTDENIVAPVSWSATEGGHELDLKAKRWYATLGADNQYQEREALPSMLAELIDFLHRTAGIPGMLGDEHLGVYLMGIAGVMYFLALVSGVVLLLPTLVKDFFALRPGKNRKRFWLDAHNVVGIASLPYHIVISLTVIVFAFHDQFYDGIEKVVYGPQPMWQAPPAQVPHAVGSMLPASELVRRVQREAPEFAVTELLFMGLESPRPRIRAAIVSPRHLVQGAVAGYVIVDPYSGKITDSSMVPGKSDTWSALVAPLFSLHFGSYGGTLVRWVYFVFGISGAFLFYSGNLLWVEKRRKNQGRLQAPVSQIRTTMLMAAATVGICLGSVFAVACTMVAGKWMMSSASNINSTYLTVYYSVFLLSVAWAFWRGAARASVDLLWACAIASAAIPVTSLAALLPLPSLGLWINTSPGALGVDATASVLALFFAWGARLTARRVASGPADSVWSASAQSSAGSGEALVLAKDA